MPQVYRRHSEYNPRPSLVPRRRSSIAPPGPQPTDADDSIVLADLVRSGEASRLRRRGAMRLEHGAAGAAVRASVVDENAGPSTFAPPVRPIVIEPSRTPTPEPNAEDVPDEYTYSAAPAWRDWDGSESRGRGEGVQAMEIVGEGSQAGQAYTLHCGGEEAAFVEEEEEPPRRFEPSLLPMFPLPLSMFPLPLSAGSSRVQGKAARRTNGCGATVHVRAYPQRLRGVWMAKEESAETVVPLDPAYCDHPAMDKMLKSACGCIREGIGCSVCGNTLGTRYVPCQAASESIFSPTPMGSTAPSPSIPHRPSGPSYWNARHPPLYRRPTSLFSSRGSSYYTFFADRVTATPLHQSTRRSPALPALVEPRRSGTRPASPEIDYGYRWTASPQPAASELPISAPPSLSPQYALPTLPPLVLNSSQLRPAPTSARQPLPSLSLITGPGPALDPDGVPLDEMDEPNSPDKEGMSWPGR